MDAADRKIRAGRGTRLPKPPSGYADVWALSPAIGPILIPGENFAADYDRYRKLVEHWTRPTNQR